MKFFELDAAFLGYKLQPIKHVGQIHDIEKKALYYI